MTSVPRLLDLIVRKFETRARLDDEDRAALRRLSYSERTIEAGRYIAREGDRTEVATLLVDGLAFRHKVTAEGSRQILSVHVPGDFVDLENCLLKVADHSVQALTMCNVAVIPETAIIELIDSHPRVERAMWVDTLIDGSIFREWIVNVGRRDARAGMCHLLCEFARRLELAGLGSPDGYEMPMSQEQLADALGLTPVHVHRVLKDLDREGLIRREKRHVLIPDWSALRKVAGFNELYLHLDQAAFPHAATRGGRPAPRGRRPWRSLARTAARSAAARTATVRAIVPAAIFLQATIGLGVLDLAAAVVAIVVGHHTLSICCAVILQERKTVRAPRGASKPALHM